MSALKLAWDRSTFNFSSLDPEVKNASEHGARLPLTESVTPPLTWGRRG